MVFDLDHWREIGAALAANKLRTLLTAFGVFWGLFMLIVMLGSGRALESGVKRQLGMQATNSFYVWTQATSKPWRGLPSGRRFRFDDADTEAIRRLVPDCAVVAPRSQLGGFRNDNNVSRGAKTGAFEVKGDVPAMQLIEPLRIVQGRFLNPLDIAEHRKVCVIGAGVVEALFEAGEEPVGQSLNVRGVWFRVIGIGSSARSGDDGDRESRAIVIPLSTFQRAFNDSRFVGWYAVLSRAGVPASQAEAKVLALLAQRHGIAPDDERAFGHYNVEEEFEKVQGLFLGIKTLVWLVGLGTLAAGVIGVSNIMLVIVRERTHELGIRRALGATPARIMGQIVLEALLLTSVAGYLGLFCGVLLLEGVRLATAGQDTGVFGAPGIDLSTALQALAVLVVSGVLAGLMPAHRAVAVSPVEALRTEA